MGSLRAPRASKRASFAEALIDRHALRASVTVPPPYERVMNHVTLRPTTAAITRETAIPLTPDRIRVVSYIRT